jgi:hypothetical protein
MNRAIIAALMLGLANRPGAADQVLRARWTELRYCHDQRQHDDVLRC